MKMTLKQKPPNSAEFLFTAEDEAELNVLRLLFEQNLIGTSIEVTIPTCTRICIQVNPATTKPPPKLPPPLDDSMCSGYKEPTCKQCGHKLVNQRDCWACTNCGTTIGMAEFIMARATEGDRQAD